MMKGIRDREMRLSHIIFLIHLFRISVQSRDASFHKENALVAFGVVQRWWRDFVVVENHG